VNDKGIPVVRKRVVLDQWQISFYEEFDEVTDEEVIAILGQSLN